jgi:hypothetical protein
VTQVNPATRTRIWSLPRLALAFALGLVCVAPATAFEEWHDTVDYTRLKNALGANVPRGAGVSISQVESVQGTNPGSDPYFADLNFIDDKPTSLPEFTGVHDPGYDPENPTATMIQFTNGTNVSRNAPSLHTNRVGARFYGDLSSVAPGANIVTIHEATHWMQSVLNYDSNSGDAFYPAPPTDYGFRVQNHSWIGTLSSTSGAVPWTEDIKNTDALRRLDYLIETANSGQGMIVAVGVANSQTPMPFLLSSSYNAIAVGRSDGFHSTGYTNGVVTPANPNYPPPAVNYAPNFPYGPWRAKPDLVAPRPAPLPVNIQTSFSTAMVSSAATLLYSAVGATEARNSEVIKAMLMAGATKSEFPGWTNSPYHPLDDTYGAGELNVYNSYLMVAGGRQVGATSGPPALAAKSSGWDYQNRKGDSAVGDIYYNLEIPSGSTASELSVILTWNVKVTDGAAAGFDPTESLQNLDLRLYNSTGSFLGTMLDQSISAVDNVEHISVRTALGPGTYTLAVSGAAGWDYGLAWRMSTAFNQTNADFDGDGSVTGSDFLAWQRNVGKLVGAAHSQGDADGDGDVDGADLAVYTAATVPAMGGGGFIPVAGPTGVGSGVGAVTGVPEPTAWALAAAAAGMLAAATRRRRTRSV